MMLFELFIGSLSLFRSGVDSVFLLIDLNQKFEGEAAKIMLGWD